MSIRARSRTAVIGSWVCVVGWVLPSYAAPPAIEGVVPPDWPAGVTAPVAVPLPESWEASGHCTLALTAGDEPESSPILGQYEPADPVGGLPPRVWFLWAGKASDHGRPVKLRLVDDKSGQDDRKRPEAVYRSHRDDPLLLVTTPDGKPVLSFWHGPADGKNEKNYPLNDFIHPLIGLDGEVLTASSPKDHIHHRGIFWAWVRTERRGKPIGSWWIPENVFVEPGALQSADGALFSRFVARHFWVHQFEGSAKGERFVEEQVVCRVFKTLEDGRAIDIDLTLTALDEGVRIGGQTYKDKGYGGLTVRFGEATDVKIECDRQVIQESTVDRLRALWVDWTGVFAGPDGKPLPHRSGGALFVDRTHPGRPPEWITRQYGPINVSYPGMEMLDLPKGKPVQLRYRLWIHRGDARQGRVNEQYRAYAADWEWPKTAKR